MRFARWDHRDDGRCGATGRVRSVGTEIGQTDFSKGSPTDGTRRGINLCQRDASVR
jgi:hypothetical protein